LPIDVDLPPSSAVSLMDIKGNVIEPFVGYGQGDFREVDRKFR